MRPGQIDYLFLPGIIKVAKVLYYLGAIVIALQLFMWLGGKITREEVNFFIASACACFLMIVLGFALKVLAEILIVLRKIESNQRISSHTPDATHSNS